MAPLTKFVEAHLARLWEESERFAKIKTLTVSLEFLKGLQTVTLIYFYVYIIFIILTASFFSLLIYTLTSYGHTGKVPVDIFVITTGGLTLSSFAFLIWALREKRILKAFKIDKKIENIISNHHSGDAYEQ